MQTGKFSMGVTIIKSFCLLRVRKASCHCESYHALGGLLGIKYITYWSKSPESRMILLMREMRKPPT